MKKNVNVFIAVLLVAVLCGGVIWLQTADEEKLGWNIHDSYGDTPSYSDGAAYTNATFAGPSAGEGGVMPLSSSSALRARTSYSYAGAYSGASSSPNSLIASSPLSSAPSGAGLYTTSSKTFNSYGGGGNGGAAMGGAMRGSSSPNSLIASSPITSISPIAYSTARRGEMVGGAAVNPAMMAAENPMVAMANAANAANAGMNTSFYGGMYATADYSSADYGQYSGMFGGGSRMGVRGRQNSPILNDPWWRWFDTWIETYGGGYFDADANGYTFNGTTLREVYNAFLADYWNSGMGDAPSFEDWLDWYQAAMAENGYYDYGDHRYFWAPVGDILPLLLIALLYLLFVAIKSKSLKSLLKTERSE
ncbi:MAG: hypothetical protein E7075_04265 [Bacteroidales bacterium]|nr:hypothetical protein [Bacteroidales bacterium]